ncbi:hypothetical protein C7B65_17375 [Phormidesmis priestleyi ULC007]|uniref:Pentapeptide repeat-containing protein n=1 Tax=Phormidesmis priestleyi ULC007 TaxID=1920490 RepID=A0A2T1DBG4_9CYAN|nr:pentapeptide repeat-containing protein [Phormidesmis priestleyi]PSB17830.1 hypothetical protein C7B65_17375 [Phormidesmis priestleyi ULC007]PZO46478.1 MAG: hypothetical protein DCF14_22670 [Phormidesmis priestleyi]
MKAKELLRRYAAGERNFQRANLCGQDLKGKDLSGSDFSYANIRGANFSHTILKDTDLTGVKAGLRGGWFIATGLLVVLVILAILSNSAVIVAIASITVIGTSAFAASSSYCGSYYGFYYRTLALALTASIAVGVVGGTSLVLSLAISRFATGSISPFIIAVGCIPVGLSLIGCIVLAGVGTKSGTVSAVVDARGSRIFGAFTTVLIGITDELMKFSIISTGGTSFLGADLTGANFTQANLGHTTFREAILDSVCWFQARGLERCQIRLRHLNNQYLRQLITTLNGQDQNFDFSNLQKVNLQGANLQDARFMGANLNHSNLRNANFSRAILKQTQLEGADLTGAILTGVYIEDWGITSTTNLEKVQCDYVYMRVPTKANPNPLRKPDNLRETFAEGEFADFIQPFFDTLDLYHSQDVDPRAVSIALKKLSQNHPEANLEIVAMEKRGQNSLNLKVRTAPTVDKSELSSEYFGDYNQLRALSETRLLLLTEKDDRIRSLEQMIQTALHQPTFNVETVQGDFMPEHRGININAGDNANISGVSSGDGVVNLGEISGNVTNTINQLPESSEPEQLSIKTLLTQLQQAIESDADLSTPDKSDLLEQVKSLAEAKKAEEPEKREGIVRKAMKMFDATLKSLPDTAKIVEACSKLLPLILKALGFPA